MESNTVILQSFTPLLETTVVAIFLSALSVTKTVGRFRSCNLTERNAIVSKLASVSAEQPKNAA